MIKLDDLKGQLSVRSINTLKRMGYMYLEEISREEVERWFLGKKTKKEILDFIEKYKEGNMMKNNNYRMVIDNDTIHILANDKTIKLTLLDREGPYVYSKIKKEIYTNGTELNSSTIIDSFHFNDVEIWGVKDTINIGDELEYEKVCNWYIDKKEV